MDRDQTDEMRFLNKHFDSELDFITDLGIMGKLKNKYKKALELAQSDKPDLKDTIELYEACAPIPDWQSTSVNNVNNSYVPKDKVKNMISNYRDIIKKAENIDENTHFKLKFKEEYVLETTDFDIETYTDEEMKKWTPSMIKFYRRHHRIHGKCPICGRPTLWNPSTSRPNKFCPDPECRQIYRNQFKERMTRVYGKTTLLDDPDFQKKMLKNRSISGQYTWSDGVKKDYVGSYELDFLEMLDRFAHFESQDVMTPAPQIFHYNYDDKNHFYIPDGYIASLNLIYEIKDGGTNPNMHPKIRAVDKVKEEIKDKKVLESDFNYLKIENKQYGKFLQFLAYVKSQQPILTKKPKLIEESSMLSHMMENFNENKLRLIESEYFLECGFPTKYAVCFNKNLNEFYIPDIDGVREFNIDQNQLKEDSFNLKIYEATNDINQPKRVFIETLKAINFIQPNDIISNWYKEITGNYDGLHTMNQITNMSSKFDKIFDDDWGNYKKDISSISEDRINTLIHIGESVEERSIPNIGENVIINYYNTEDDEKIMEKYNYIKTKIEESVFKDPDFDILFNMILLSTSLDDIKFCIGFVKNLQMTEPNLKDIEDDFLELASYKYVLLSKGTVIDIDYSPIINEDIEFEKYDEDTDNVRSFIKESVLLGGYNTNRFMFNKRLAESRDELLEKYPDEKDKIEIYLCRKIGD